MLCPVNRATDRASRAVLPASLAPHAALAALAVLAALMAPALGCGSASAAPAATPSDAAAPAKTSPDAKALPTATGTCPAFTTGKNTFAPAGIAPRDVLLTIGAEADAKDGPLVFFWHGAGGDPSEAAGALGPAVAGVTSAGGIVAAPYHDPAAGDLPWFLSTGGTRDDDLRLADEILACAIARKGVDLRRIHSVGFSAGAMNTTQFALRRSSWVASIVVYSGAQIFEVDPQDATNEYPAMLFYGGPNDQVVVNFDDASHAYHDWLTANGHFSFLCNHGRGHTVPSDGRASAWQFLQDHPYGASPEPYAAALPAGFPTYCTL
jgi:predicted esterase